MHETPLNANSHVMFNQNLISQPLAFMQLTERRLRSAPGACRQLDRWTQRRQLLIVHQTTQFLHPVISRIPWFTVVTGTAFSVE
jgi:hypothetical protein